jgi:predicted Zn finger-like uncharacterized protein
LFVPRITWYDSGSSRPDGFFGGYTMPIIVACPSCNGQLRVADDLIGRKVRCPACNTTFDVSESPSEPPPLPEIPVETESLPAWKHLNLELSSDSSSGDQPDERPAGRQGRSGPVGAVEIGMTRDEPEPRARGPSEPPPLREQRGGRDEGAQSQRCRECGERMYPDETRCPACGERVQERPRRRSRREAEEDDDDYPRRRPMRRDWEPHRGGMILTFGIISAASIMLAMCYGLTTPFGIGFGIAAWVMGSRDLKKIRAGSMDPDGEGSTQAGWICGIIGVCLNTLALLACGAFVYFIFYVQNEAARQMRNRPNPGPPPARRPF